MKDCGVLNSCGELYWRGCYDGSPKLDKYLAPESYAHPAKMSRRLCDRILRHLEELKLLQKGSTVIDFLGGIGTTNLIASLRGYKSVSVELEPHFVEMQEKNRELFERKTGRKAEWSIIQGDSRRLSEILTEGGVGVVSPPYQNQTLGFKGNKEKFLKKGWIPKGGINFLDLDYGGNPLNIGNLKDRPLVGITSPPYANRMDGGGKYTAGMKPYSGESADKWFTERDETNIGNLVDGTQSRDRRESYLSAMFQVYSEAYKAGISPLVVVVKNPTRDGKLRRLDLDTIGLLEKAGYKIFDYHRAILFEEHEQGTLDNGRIKKTRGRLSFFKRLSYQKGSPVAQWEDVIFAVKDGEVV